MIIIPVMILLFSLILPSYGFAQDLVLKTIASPNGKVVAHWGGENPGADRTLEYCIEKLWFTFPPEETAYEFKPKGSLSFGHGSFDIFSPKGTYVLLLQADDGPYHVVSTRRLKAYLRGKAGPDAVVSAHDYGGHRDHPSKVHGGACWVSDHSFEFSGACCATEMRYLYDTSTKEVSFLFETPMEGRKERKEKIPFKFLMND